MVPLTISELEETALKVRKDIIEMIYRAGSGHPGGSLSSVDILTALFFGGVINVDKKDAKNEKRDRFILSKGHAAPALYAVLANEGYFSKKLLKTLRKLGSPLQGHPDSRKLPGVESSTGSLGQGLSVAGGIALAGKLDKKDYRIFCLCGDGEIQEGQIWEAAMACPHYKLDNLCLFVDNNGLQIDGLIEEVMNVYPIGDKFKAFNWNVMEIDGHDFNQIEQSVEFFKSNKGSGKPTMIVSHTIKGKCVSFMENKSSWHGVAPNKEETQKALDELGCVESLEDWLKED